MCLINTVWVWVNLHNICKRNASVQVTRVHTTQHRHIELTDNIKNIRTTYLFNFSDFSSIYSNSQFFCHFTTLGGVKNKTKIKYYKSDTNVFFSTHMKFSNHISVIWHFKLHWQHQKEILSHFRPYCFCCHKRQNKKNDSLLYKRTLDMKMDQILLQSDVSCEMLLTNYFSCWWFWVYPKTITDWMYC